MNTRMLILLLVPISLFLGCAAYAGPRGVVRPTPVVAARVSLPVGIGVVVPPPSSPRRVLVRPARPASQDSTANEAAREP